MAANPRLPVPLNAGTLPPLPIFSNATSPRGVASSGEVPHGWKVLVHPKGYIYFRHASSGIVTNHDVIRSRGLSNNPKTQDAWAAAAGNYDVRGGHECIVRSDGSLLFINHETCVASADSADLKQTDAELAHRPDRYSLRRDYWLYMLEHPTHKPLAPGHEQKALESLRWCYAEGLMRGSASDGPLSKERAQEVREFLLSEDMKGSSTTKTALISWVMFHIYGYRHRIQYGRRRKVDHDLRSPNQSARGAGGFLNFLLRLFVVLLMFGAPFNYLSHINHFRDGNWSSWSNLERWHAYIQRLIKEWTDFNLVAAVLLSGTVGFLAIPSLDGLASTAALISVMFSLGSIVSGVYLVWRHQAKLDHKLHFVWYLKNTNQRYGAEAVAVFLALPIVLLVWAVIAFAFAVVTFSFRGFFTQANDVRVPFRAITSWMVSGFGVAVLILVMVALYLFIRIWRPRPTRLPTLPISEQPPTPMLPIFATMPEPQTGLYVPSR